MAYAADAVVEEPVTASRASLTWLTTRAYRSGQTYGLLRLRKGESRAKVVAVSLAKVAVLHRRRGAEDLVARPLAQGVGSRLPACRRARRRDGQGPARTLRSRPCVIAPHTR